MWVRIWSMSQWMGQQANLSFLGKSQFEAGLVCACLICASVASVPIVTESSIVVQACFPSTLEARSGSPATL